MGALCNLPGHVHGDPQSSLAKGGRCMTGAGEAAVAVEH